MNEAPLVSVIVPCYNQRKLIEKCLKSIIRQTYTNLEIIVVNDGSTDKSLEVLINMANKDMRLKIINQQNAGVESARMTGINKSNGEFIFFVDGDDTIPKKAIESLVEEAQFSSSDIVIGQTKKMIFNIPIKTLPDRVNQKKIEQPELFDKYYISYFGVNLLPVTIWATLYKTKIVKEHLPQLTGLNHGEDLLFNMHLYPYVKSVSMIDTCVYYYRTGGMTTKLNEKLFQTACQAYEYKIKQIQKYKYEQATVFAAIELINFLKTYIRSYYFYTSYNHQEIASIIQKEIDNSNFEHALNIVMNSKYNNEQLTILQNDIEQYVIKMKPTNNQLIIKKTLSRLL